MMENSSDPQSSRSNDQQGPSPEADTQSVPSANVPGDPHSTTLRVHEPSRVTWDLLSKRLEAFIASWETADAPPEIAPYVADQPKDRRLVMLVELIKVDLDYRWASDHSQLTIEDYLQRFPELGEAGDVPVDLIYEEYYIRQRHGAPVSAQQCMERFPKQADAIKRLLGNTLPVTSTALLTRKPRRSFDVGMTIDDFDLLTLLGEGAFAKVFLARQISLQRMVALKISSNQGTEPQTLAQLDHPNIVRVYDQRVLADDDCRLLYMKYMPGGTLQQVIEYAGHLAPESWDGATVVRAVDQALDRRGESPPWESAIRDRLLGMNWTQVVSWFGLQLASALQYSHRQQVLHRDLKPANILLSAEGVPQVVDFNISFCSKVDGAVPAAYFGGSLAYMAPEQLQACDPAHQRQPEELTEHIDCYALGVVLWEMFTGRRPFTDRPLDRGWSATLQQMVQDRQQGPSESGLDHAGGVEAGALIDVLSRCLSFDPADRFQSAEQLSASLRLCVDQEVLHLLRPAPRSWVHTARHWIWSFVTLIVLLPNVLAAVFNYIYNRTNIINLVQDAQQTFQIVQTVINSIAFPVGLVVCAIYGWPVLQAARSDKRRIEQTPDSQLEFLRWRALRLGYFVAGICMIEWGLAGMAYPIAMRTAGVALSYGEILHFVSSLILSGLVAAAYPFFGATAFALRVIYPPLVRVDPQRRLDAQRLDWLRQRTWFFLGLSFLIPMLSVLLLAIVGGQHHRLMLGMLSGAGLIGSLLILVLARGIFKNISTLSSVYADP